MYVSNPKDYAKNAIVERFNITHRRSMVVYKEQNNNTPLTRANIAQITETYNNDLRSTIKAKPDMVYDLKDKNNQKYKFVDFKLSKGDRVRTLDGSTAVLRGQTSLGDRYSQVTITSVKFSTILYPGTHMWGTGDIEYRCVCIRMVEKNCQPALHE
jgi:hypothetical protein